MQSDLRAEWLRIADEIKRLREESGDVGEPLYITTQTSHAWENTARALANRPDAQGGWRPIESAPRDGTHILSWCSGRARTARWTTHGGPPRWLVAFDANISAGNCAQPTHWQPLPPAPENTNEPG